jgi:tetratricopeptide (TPR) repeat protein
LSEFRGVARLLRGLVFAAAVAAGAASSLPPARAQEPPADSGPRERARALNDEGIRAYDTGNFAEAVRRFEEARAQDPANDVLSKNLARALHGRTGELLKQGRYHDAVADLRRAATLDAGEVQIPIRLASVLKDHGDFAQAREVLGRALEAKPGESLLHEALGRLEYDDEQLDKAVELLETAAKLDAARAKDWAPYFEKVKREAQVEKSFFRDQKGNLLVKYDDSEFRDVGASVLAMLEAAYEKLGTDFAHWPARRIAVVLYTRGDYDAATGAKDWTGGLFDGKIRLPVRNFAQARDGIRATLVHELTHLFVRSMTLRCPLWLNEGLAQYQEGVRSAGMVTVTLRRRLEDERLPRIASLPGNWASVSDRETVSLYYAIGLGFTQFLIERYGFGGIRDVLAELE